MKKRAFITKPFCRVRDFYVKFHHKVLRNTLAGLLVAVFSTVSLGISPLAHSLNESFALKHGSTYPLGYHSLSKIDSHYALGSVIMDTGRESITDPECLPTPDQNDIAGTVFNDLNQNGIQDSGETGDAGIEVDIYLDNNANGVVDAGDTKVGTAATDANGDYVYSIVPIYIHDTFDGSGTGDLDGGYGAWTTNWIQGPGSGTPSTYPSLYMDNNEMLYRSLDLSGAGVVSIDFWITNTGNLEYPDDGVIVDVCSDASFTNCQTVLSERGNFPYTFNSEQAIDADGYSISNPCSDGAIVGTPTLNDPDADGINNDCDLDDDNDGILDTDETATCLPVVFPTDFSTGPCTNCIASGWQVISGDPDLGNTANASAFYPWSTPLPPAPNGTTDFIVVRDIGPTYIEENVGTNISNLIPGQSYSLNFYVIRQTAPGYGGGLADFVYLTIDGIETTITLTETPGVWQEVSIPWIPTTNFSYLSLRPGNNALSVPFSTYFQPVAYSFDINSSTCQLDNDIDDDGYDNHLDTDSDGDGCPDALEGGANFTTDNLDNNDQLTGTVNSSGIPTQAGNGQDIGTSQDADDKLVCIDPCDPIESGNIDTDGDGVSDLCDLDDDNDGILDVEEGYTCTSNNSDNTILNDFGVEEDQLQSTAYSALLKLNNSFWITGKSASSTGANLDEYQEINNENYPGLTGHPLFATQGGEYSTQHILITDDNKIWVWGDQGEVVPTHLTGGVLSAPIRDITASLGLPPGVSANDIKMFKAGHRVLGLLTKSGALYVQIALRGNLEHLVHGAVETGQWVRSELTAGNPLTDIVDFDIVNPGIAALTASGTIYTWGANVTDGNGSAFSSEDYPIAMVNPLPVGEDIVQLEVSSDDYRLSYFILGRDRRIYVTGNNDQGILGIGNTTDKTTWTNTLNEAGTAPLENVKYIAPSDNTTLRTAVASLLYDGTARNWGSNSNYMIGAPGYGSVELPLVPEGTLGNTYDAVETGAFISPYLSGNTISNVGRNEYGSFGDGTSTNRDSYQSGPSLNSTAPPPCSNGIDTDNDGIFDHLDLDSDNDGCPDYIEGAANFTDADGEISLGSLTSGSGSSVNENLGNIVAMSGADIGIPIVAGSGQAVGYSQNRKADACQDSDGDGISDLDDLDDDNDGITDCVEKGLGGYASVFNITGAANPISSDEIQITPAQDDLVGSVFSKERIDLNRNFSLSFDAYFGTNNAGADGIAIVFHNDPLGSHVTGISGSGIGANNIQDGIVLELDTHDNGADDPSNDHGHIWDSDNQNYLGNAVELGQLEDGNWHSVDIEWNTATKTLSYLVDDIPAGSFSDIDIYDNYFGGSNLVYFGFTAATGGRNNDHRIRFSGGFCDFPVFVDTDGDGIENHLDLDSDNDNCADFLEAGKMWITDGESAAGVVTGGPGSTVSDNLGIIIGTGASNGIPTLVGAGNGIGYSQDASDSRSCLDSDGDGLADMHDLDDDNDGILDTDECTMTPPPPPIGNLSAFTFIDSGSDDEVGDRTIYDNAGSYNGTPFDLELVVISNPSPNTLNIDIDNSNGVLIYLTGSNVGAEPEFQMNFYSAGTTTPLEIPFQGMFNDIDGSGTAEALFFRTADLEFYQLSANSNLTVTNANEEIGFEGLTTDSSPTDQNNWAKVRILPSTGFNFRARKRSGTPGYNFISADFTNPAPAVGLNDAPFICFEDTDGDGTVNSLDLDSDDDGCPDAMEGSIIFAATDLDANERLSGLVDDDGIPLVVNGGQGDFASQDDSVNGCCRELDPDIAAPPIWDCNTTQLQLDGSGSVLADSYLWTTTDGTISSGANTATPTITSVGTYTMTVYAPFGCEDSESVTIALDPDAISPTITQQPSDLTIECGADNTTEIDTWVAMNGGATATDNCGITDWTADIGTYAATCGSATTAEVTFIVDDGSGNSEITNVVNIIIQDTTDPVAPTPPTDIFGQCAADVPVPIDLTATDNCAGSITGSPTDVTTPGSCPNSYVITRTWTFNDGCNSDVSISQIITINDDTAPVAPTAPADVNGQCIADVPAPIDLTAIDNCDGNITVSPTDVTTPGSCPNSYVITRTWTFADGCDNVSSVSQTITINDDTAPVAPTAPADVIGQCVADVPAPIDLTATDNCDGSITVSPTDATIPGSCPNSFVITRTWTFGDGCGNETSVSQTITITDETAPVAPAAPADVIGQCAADVPAPIDLTATDNCDGLITVSPTDATTPGSCPNSYVITRTWTFADDCGNASSVSQTITINDDTAPILPTAPGPVQVQSMADVPTPVDLTATDNCDGDITITPVDFIAPGPCPNSQVITRTWIFIDGCSNESSVSQIITINDDTPPVAPTPPDDVAGDCANDVPAEVDLTAIDNADGPITVSPTSVVTSGNCPNSFLLVRTWTFIDGCGNESSVQQEIDIQDSDPPLPPPAPADVTVQCVADVPAPIDLNAAGNCVEDITTSPIDVITPGSCPNSFVIERTWRFEDVCGNVRSTSQTITVNDDTPPVAPAPPADVTGQCSDDIPPLVDLTATDNCDGAITVSPVDVTSPGSCPNSYVITRTWTFTDGCGNVSSTIQTININDTTAPTITPGSNMTVECDGSGNTTQLQDWLDNNGGASALDGCSSVTWTHNFTSLSDLCGATGTASVTFTATDECGNTDDITLSFTIVDTADPVISGGDSPTVECDGAGNQADLQTWLDNNGRATATDDCGTVTWTNNFTELSDLCGATGTASVTFTATDECGNTDDITLSFTIVDTTDPIISGGDSPTVECGDPGNQAALQTWLDNNGRATATDDCGTVTWTNNFTELSDLCGATGTASVTFTATDECGNTDDITLSFTIVDTTDPIISGGASPTVECGDPGNQAALQTWLDNNGRATATDDCGTVTWTNNFTELSDLCGATGTASVTFTATDECGNTDDITLSFTIVDTTDPVISDGDSPTVECGDPGNQAALQNWLDNNGRATAFDDCGTVTWTNNFTELSDLCGATGTASVTFTATDECGNTDDITLSFTIVDTTDPVISGGDSPTVECGDPGNQAALQNWLDNNGRATAFDDCGTVTWTNNFTELSDLCGATGTASVTFTATDECGNTDDITLSFTIVDTTDPIISGGDSPTVECGDPGNQAALQNWLDNNGRATAFDDCGTVTWTNNFTELSDLCGATGTASVTFTATDECGNTDDITLSFTIVDTTDPVISGGDSPTVECGDPGNQAALQNWLDNNGRATAFDDCGTVTWTNNFTELSDLCGATGTASVTFTATDECGNTDDITLSFTIVDTTDPVITGGDSPTVECDGAGNQADLQTWLDNNGGASATDDCGTVSWTHNYTALSDLCGATGTASVTFTATDECGNTDDITLSFTIVDTTDPVISGGDSPTVECGDPGNQAALQNWLDNNGRATAFDDCGTVTWTNNFTELSDLCGATGTASVTFTATDECGNTDDITLSFTIVDTTDPIISDGDSPTVECGDPGNQAALQNWLDNNGRATAFDDCGTVTWTNNFTELSDLCGATGTASVTFTATDECGNTDDITLSFTIVDTTDPVISGGDSPTVECGDPGNQAALQNWLDNNGRATATDDCGTVTWTNNFTELSDLCGATGTASVTFTATDECGNTDDITLSFTIVDTTDPIISDGDSPTVECGDPGNQAALQNWLDNNGRATAFDDCGTVTWTNNFTELSDLCGATGTASVTFTATDECGNTDDITLSFTIVDTADPVISGGDSPTVECGDPGNQAALQNWLDNNGRATAFDDCGTVTWTNNFTELSDLCGATGTASVTFTATDECGNTDDITLSFTIVDTADPVISGGDSPTVECGDPGNQADLQTWLDNNGRATAFDDCGTVTWTNNFTELSDLCGATGTASVTFTATDECGNTDDITLSFTIVDTADPVISGGDSPTVECGDPGNQAALQNWLDNNGRATAFDDCGTVTWTNNFTELSDLCGATGTASVTFTATDECGNTDDITLSFTIVDTADPVISGGDSPTVECDGAGNQADLQTWLDNNGRATAFDDCGTVTWTNNFTELSDLCGATGTASVTFTATDECGNTDDITLSFTIVDTADPVISGGDSPTVECGDPGNQADLQNWLDNNGRATAFDDCGTVTWTNNFTELSDLCGATGTASVTFTATDECGNTDDITLSFTIVDTTDPVISGGDSPTVECGDPGNQADLQTWLDNNGRATATDDCGTVTWTNNFTELSDLCGATGTASVTFTATDECGNTDDITLSFTIVDTADPVISGGDSPTVECDGAGNQADLQTWLDNNGRATATDDCGTVTWTNNFTELSDLCGATGTASVTFTATDECGNTDDITLSFTIIDTNPPVISNSDVSTSVSCDNIPGAIQPLVNDECDNSPSIWLNERIEGNQSSGCYTLIRTWVVEDDCNNRDSSIQIIIVRDTIAPTFTTPADIIVYLDETNLADTTLASIGSISDVLDNCSSNLQTYYRDSIVSVMSNQVVYDVHRIWTVEDACGNARSQVQQISLVDTIGPSFTRPIVMQVDCEFIPPLDTIDFDDVNGIFDIHMNEVRMDTPCTDRPTIVRTWTATDGVGNVSSVDRVLNVTSCNTVLNVSITNDTPCAGEFVTLNSNFVHPTLNDLYNEQWYYRSTPVDAWEPISGGNQKLLTFPAYSFRSGDYNVVYSSPMDDSVCDYVSEVLTLKVNGNQPVTHRYELICEGETYQINDTSFARQGNYNLVYPSSTGCDSIVTLHLTVVPTITTARNMTICTGEFLEISNGDRYYTSAIYYDSLLNVNNCDSIIVISLSVLPEIQDTLIRQICSGESFDFNGNSLTTSGVYIDTLPSSFSCDRVVVLDLRISETIRNYQKVTICSGESYAFDGYLLNKDTIWQRSFPSTGGCDSLVTLDLTIVDHMMTTLNDTMCYGEMYVFGNQTLIQNGVYRHTYTSIDGCDSIVELNLYMRDEIATSFDIALCAGEAFEYKNINYSSPQTMTDVVQSSTGCDSTIVFNLQIENPEIVNDSIVLCTGDSVLIGSNYIKSSGSFTAQLYNSLGCQDSTVLYNVNILETFNEYRQITLCTGDSLLIGGIYRHTEGVYKEKLQSIITGCDSTIQMEVTLDENIKLSSEDINICKGEQFTIVVDGAENISWNYSDLLSCNNCPNPSGNIEETTTFIGTTDGCADQELSIAVTVQVFDEVQLQVLTPDTSLTIGESIFLDSYISDPFTQITWYDEHGNAICNNCSSVEVSPQSNTFYYAQANSDSGCTVSDTVYTNIKDGCAEGEIIVPNYLSPNADGVNDNIRISYHSIKSVNQMKIYNRWGELVFKTDDIENEQWDGTYKGTVSNAGVYVYFLEYQCLNDEYVFKKGTITILK